jgi:hypothetical protein
MRRVAPLRRRATFPAILFVVMVSTAIAEEPLKLRGRVVLPDGTPAVGAELRWPHKESPSPWAVRQFEYQKVGVSDAEGRFELAVSENDMPAAGLLSCLVACQKGLGIAWYEVQKGEIPPEITLQLVEDHPIRGRIIDTEGRPISGALLSVTTLLASRDGSLDIYLSAWQDDWHLAWTKLHRAGGQLVRLDGDLSAVTDADGRFELSGVGRERVATVEIQSEGHAADALRVVNRPGFDAAPYNDIILARATPYAREEGLDTRLSSPELNYVAEPEVVVRGQIFTGIERTPLKGAIVRSSGRGDFRGLSVTSDAQGHYELGGLGRNRHHILIVPAPPGSDLLDRSATATAAPGQAAIELDLELKHGIVVEGRMFDQTTGHGVSGSVSYVPLPGNEFANQPGFDHFIRSDGGGVHADEEGRFRIKVIPGLGVLMGHVGSKSHVGAYHVNPYRRATFSEADRQRVLPKEDGDDRYFTRSNGSVAFLGHVAKVLDLPTDSKPVTCDLPLDQGKTTDLSIEDAEGRPLRDAVVSGLGDGGPLPTRIAESTCLVFALGADRPRRVCIFHPERKLAASLTLTGDEVGPVKVRLDATALITGRALDPDGEPIPSALVMINYARRSASEIDRFLRLEHPTATTDNEGRFEVGNVLPDERFALDFRQDKSYFRANLTDEQRQLKAGKTLDLGETKLKQLPIATAE